MSNKIIPALIDAHRKTLLSLFNNPYGNQSINLETNALPQTWRILIVDDTTEILINHLFNVNTLLSNGISLILKIEKNRQVVSDAECIYFIKASKENIDTIVDDITNGLYRAYHIIFSSIYIPSSENQMILEGGSVNANIVSYFGTLLKKTPPNIDKSKIKSVKTYCMQAWDVIPSVFTAISNDYNALFSYIIATTNIASTFKKERSLISNSISIPLIFSSKAVSGSDEFKLLQNLFFKQYQGEMKEVMLKINPKYLESFSDSILIILSRNDDLAAPFMVSNSYIGNVTYLAKNVISLNNKLKNKTSTFLNKPIDEFINDSILEKLWNVPFLLTPDIIKKYIEEHKQTQELVRDGSSSSLESVIGSLKDITSNKEQMDKHSQWAGETMKKFIKLNEYKVKSALDSFLKSSETMYDSISKYVAQKNSGKSASTKLFNTFPYDISDLLRLFEEPTSQDDEAKKSSPWNISVISSNIIYEGKTNNNVNNVTKQPSLFDEPGSLENQTMTINKVSEESMDYLKLVAINILSTLTVCILSSYPAIISINTGLMVSNDKYTNKMMPEWWLSLAEVAFQTIQYIIDTYATGQYDIILGQNITVPEVNAVKIDNSSDGKPITQSKKLEIFYLLKMKEYINKVFKPEELKVIQESQEYIQGTNRVSLMSTLKKGLKSFTTKSTTADSLKYSNFLMIPKIATSIYQAIMKYRLKLNSQYEYSLSQLTPSLPSITDQQPQIISKPTINIDDFIKDSMDKNTKYNWPTLSHTPIINSTNKENIEPQNSISAIKRICLYVLGGITWDEVAAFETFIRDTATNLGIPPPKCTIGSTKILDRKECFESILERK